MKIPPEQNFNCSKCGEKVGITKATANSLKNVKEKLQPVCAECYNKHFKPNDIEIVPLTKEQITELKDYEKNL